MGNINFFKLIQLRQVLYKMLNFRKTMRFFLGTKSQSSTHQIWELEKLYTIIEFINIHGLHGHIFTHICAQEKVSSK